MTATSLRPPLRALAHLAVRLQFTSTEAQEARLTGRLFDFRADKEARESELRSLDAVAEQVGLFCRYRMHGRVRASVSHGLVTQARDTVVWPLLHSGVCTCLLR